MAVRKKYSALGRGLDALISTEDVKTQGSSTINEIPIDQIEANPNQPRREFEETALNELAQSISEIGIVVPITLRQMGEHKYQIIAGERRWRASQIAGLTSLPAYIRTIKDEEVMEMALVENIQREDLNDIEIALAYEHLDQLPASAETPRTGSDGFAEQDHQHGTCPCPALSGESCSTDQVVQGNPEERLFRSSGGGTGEDCQGS